MHTSTKWLLGELAVIVVILAALGPLGYPFVLPYAWHKLLHLIGAVLLIGNISVTGAWMALAMRTKEPLVVGFAAKAVNWMDVVFTLPGIFLIAWNGLTLANRWGGPLGQDWIVWGSVFFGLSGIIYIAVLVRDQEKLVRLASSEGLTPRFAQVFRRWAFFGIIATITPLVSLAFMVLRPDLG